jgi:hypothetical protein
MGVRIFTSELSRCLKTKTIYKILFWLLVFLLLVGIPIFWLLTYREPKTEKDYITEYLHCRLIFTPDTAKEAYYCPLQFRDPYYEARIKPYIDYIKNKQIYQIFRLKDLKKDVKHKNIWLADGILIRFTCEDKEKCKKLYESKVKIKIYKVQGKYTLGEEF